MKRTVVGILLAASALLLSIFPPAFQHAPQTLPTPPSLTSTPVNDTIPVPSISTPTLTHNSPTTLSPTPSPSLSQPQPATASHPLWPEATLLSFQETPPLNGLIRQQFLLQPKHFPYPVYIEEKLTELALPSQERVVHRTELVASHLLVKLKPDAPTTPPSQPTYQHSLSQLHDITHHFATSIQPHPTAPGLFFLHWTPLHIRNVTEYQTLLNQYPEFIDYVETDPIVRAAALTPNDPRFAPEQWNLNNSGQDSGTADVDINAPEAWEIRRDATNIIIAVVDSGIRYTHEDLAANMWRNPGETPGNGIDDDGNGFIDDIHGINALEKNGTPLDDLPDPVLGIGGHGTSVAGVIAAAGNNGKGIAGVAWYARLMALKWFNNQGAGALSDAIQCLDYARTQGASIVNASWQQGGLLTDTVNQSMIDAILRLRDAGILFVASAGNDGANNDQIAHYPSNYPFDNMVAVAAGTRTGSLWKKSNFGERLVDIVAPGENILTTTSKSDSDYALVSGTSFAAPHVTGILALLKAHFPAEDHRTLIQRLLHGGKRMDKLTGKVRSGAFVNAANALKLTAVTPFPEITTFRYNDVTAESQQEISVIQGTNLVLSVEATGAAPLAYSWRHDGKLIAGSSTNKLSLPNFSAADIGEYQVAVSNKAGIATLSIRLLGVVSKPEIATAVNAAGRTFFTSGNKLWESQNNISRDGVSAGGTGRITGRQNTTASTSLTGPGVARFQWKVSSERNNDTLDCLVDGIRIESISGETDWTKKEIQLSPGNHQITWRYVKDGSLSKGQDRGFLDLFEFVADAQSPPTITVQPASQTTTTEGSTVFLSVVAQGSEPLSYQWQRNGTNVANATSSRLDLIQITPSQEGRYTVVVSNKAGVVVSSAARVTITPSAIPPRLTLQPTPLTVNEGASAQFQIAFQGTPPFQIQWRKGTTPLPGQTNATLTLAKVTAQDNGLYNATISNSAGTQTSSNATLTVVQFQLAPVITKQPAHQQLLSGQTLELAVEADGLGPFTYQWSKNGQILPGQTQADFTRTNASATDAGSYQVKISSPFGSTLSAPALVKIAISTPPLAQGLDSTTLTWSTEGDTPWFLQSQTTWDGSDALQSGPISHLQSSQIKTTVTGPGQISFFWKVSSEYGYDYLDFYVDDQFWDGISGEWGWEEMIWNLPEGTHTLTWIYSKDSEASAGSDAAWLDRVNFISFNTELPVIVQHPINTSGLLGGTVSFNVQAAGAPPLTFQWFRDNQPVPNATNAFLTLNNLNNLQQGFYHAAVSNQLGSAISRVAYFDIFDLSDSIDAALNSPGLVWTNYGFSPWFPQSEVTYDGVSAMQTSALGNGGVSWLSTFTDSPGILYFTWKVSSEADYDVLEFRMDDHLQDLISGEIDWQDFSILVPPGIHRFDWIYSKDDYFSEGEDAGWLDFVEFQPLSTWTYWTYLYFTPEELALPEISGGDADPDSDTIPNTLEYAYGLDPFTPDSSGLPEGRLETLGNQTRFALVFRRRLDDPTLRYHVEVSSDLQNWSETSSATWTETSTPLDYDLEEVHLRLRAPLTASPRGFYRIRVTFGDGPQ